MSLSPADNEQQRTCYSAHFVKSTRMHMSRGSNGFKPIDLPESNSSGYPAPFRDGQRNRSTRRLGDHGGLKNFGVNLLRVEPGGESSARHSLTKQDDFVYSLEGVFSLVTHAGRETIGPGP